MGEDGMHETRRVSSHIVTQNEKGRNNEGQKEKERGSFLGKDSDGCGRIVGDPSCEGVQIKLSA